MQNKLRGWLADNSLTADPKDRILVLESAGNDAIVSLGTTFCHGRLEPPTHFTS